MKLQYTLTISFCVLMLALLNGCGNKEQAAAPEPQSAEQIAMQEAGTPPEPTQLPVRYQNPGYVVSTEAEEDGLGRTEEQYALKVGANITSTKGPQPLWDIVKRLGNLKGMSVSWASDVDQSLLVDVNIKASDNFFEALDNLLRQVDYFHVIKDNTIIIKYRETKKFYISLPNMKGTYSTTVGGNYLTDRAAASGTEGTVKITSDENKFDIWQNIIDNLDTIMQEWGTAAETASSADNTAVISPGAETTTDNGTTTTQTRQRSQSGSYYILDKSVGLITVTAPRPMLEKIEYYLDNLKKELYRQVVIEAKIIEVYLSDNSKIGLDWSAVLKDFNLNGIVEFGTGGLLGQVYPQTKDGNGNHVPFVSKVSMGAATFNVMLNALNEQGDAKVLSNPKLTVMNGQPALISVGKDIAYIKTVSKNVDSTSGGSSTTTYTAEVDNVVEGIAMGVVASIIDDDSVVLHLTPITTDLIPVEGQEIFYKQFGDGLEVGLPKVGVREMSTMVKVKNGEMLIIGGLIDSIEGKSGKFAPVLGDIPILKYLFGVEEKQMEKRELVILLTPRVI